MLLEGNESLSGKVLNETFQVRTPYATVRLDAGAVTELERNGAAGDRYTVRTINGTRVSGHLEDPAILLREKTKYPSNSVRFLINSTCCGNNICHSCEGRNPVFKIGFTGDIVMPDTAPKPFVFIPSSHPVDTASSTTFTLMPNASEP